MRLRIFLFALSTGFLGVIIVLVSKKRMQLKYSLLWISMGIILLTCAAFPNIVAFFSSVLGVATPANLVFLMGLIMIAAICVSLTIITSWQSRDIRTLIQRVALLEKELIEARNDFDSIRREQPHD